MNIYEKGQMLEWGYTKKEIEQIEMEEFDQKEWERLDADDTGCLTDVEGDDDD